MVGGYAMIDCKGLELTSESSQTITGLYRSVQEAVKSNKPVYAYNCEWEDDIMTPVSVMITPRSNNTYIATASTLQIVVAPDDSVTIINMLA